MDDAKFFISAIVNHKGKIQIRTNVFLTCGFKLDLDGMPVACKTLTHPSLLLSLGTAILAPHNFESLAFIATTHYESKTHNSECFRLPCCCVIRIYSFSKFRHFPLAIRIEQPRCPILCLNSPPGKFLLVFLR